MEETLQCALLKTRLKEGQEVKTTKAMSKLKISKLKTGKLKISKLKVGKLPPQVETIRITGVIRIAILIVMPILLLLMKDGKQEAGKN